MWIKEISNSDSSFLPTSSEKQTTFFSCGPTCAARSGGPTCCQRWLALQRGWILSKFKCAAPPFVTRPAEILLDAAANIAALALQVSRLMAAAGVCDCVSVLLCLKETILSPDRKLLSSFWPRSRMTSSSHVVCFVLSFSYCLFAWLFIHECSKKHNRSRRFPKLRNTGVTRQ